MPSMDNWDDLGYYLKYLVDTKSPGKKQRIILEIFKDEHVDHSEYNIIWDVPTDLYETTTRLLTNKLLAIQPERRYKVIHDIKLKMESLLERENKRYNKKRDR